MFKDRGVRVFVPIIYAFDETRGLLNQSVEGIDEYSGSPFRLLRYAAQCLMSDGYVEVIDTNSKVGKFDSSALREPSSRLSQYND